MNDMSSFNAICLPTSLAGEGQEGAWSTVFDGFFAFILLIHVSSIPLIMSTLKYFYLTFSSHEEKTTIDETKSTLVETKLAKQIDMK